MLEFHNVTKRYKNKVVALNHVSFSIRHQDFVFLIGASGAGKSTITRLILKEERASEGKIMLYGQDITNVRARQIPAIRRSVGMVFQDFRLLENKTVYDNLKYVLDILGESKASSKRIIHECLELVNLTDRMKSYPNQLSGGEQQRVSIARAMVTKPKLLIADEPTGNLDPNTAQEIMNALIKINQSGTSILMATHAKEIVNQMKKRVIYLENGVILRDEKAGRYDWSHPDKKSGTRQEGSPRKRERENKKLSSHQGTTSSEGASTDKESRKWS